MYKQYNKLTIHTLKAPREFMEDIQDFIRLNRHQYYEPQLNVEQRIFYLLQNNNVHYYGDFMRLFTEALHLIYEKKEIEDKTVIIISNEYLQSLTYFLDYMGISEYNRIVQDRHVKTWIIDNDYKNILIFNFGDYEVRTGILTGLENRQLYALDNDITLRKLDNQYPHICYKCKKPLKLGELCIANKDKTKEELIELWKNKYVEFYCCGCYRKECG